MVEETGIGNGRKGRINKTRRGASSIETSYNPEVMEAADADHLPQLVTAWKRHGPVQYFIEVLTVYIGD